MKRLNYRIEVIIKGRNVTPDKLALVEKEWKLALKEHCFCSEDLELKVARIKRIPNPKDDKMPIDAWRKIADSSLITQTGFKSPKLHGK